MTTQTRRITAADVAALVPQNTINVKASYGAKGDGTTDDTIALQNALASSISDIFLPDGTYNFSSTLNLNGTQCLRASTQGGVTLKWVGANNVDLIKTANTNYASMKNISVDAGIATGINMLHLSDAQFGTYENLTFNGQNGAGNLALLITAGDSGTGSSHNSGQNTFRTIRGYNIAKGLKLSGNPSGPTVVTLNNFYGIDFEGATTAGAMYDFAQWCDTNNFYYARAALGADGSTGVVFNSAAPTKNNGVYSNNFFYLNVDAFGSVLAQTGITMNWTKENYIAAFYHSPDTFPGTLLNVTANAQSYYIVNNNKAVASNSMEVLSLNAPLTAT